MLKQIKNCTSQVHHWYFWRIYIFWPPLNPVFQFVMITKGALSVFSFSCLVTAHSLHLHCLNSVQPFLIWANLTFHMSRCLLSGTEKQGQLGPGILLQSHFKGPINQSWRTSQYKLSKSKNFKSWTHDSLSQFCARVDISAIVNAVSFLPIYVLLRFESVEHSTGEGSSGELEVDSMHPGVFIQLQHLLYDLHANTQTKSMKRRKTFWENNAVSTSH